MHATAVALLLDIGHKGLIPGVLMPGVSVGSMDGLCLGAGPLLCILTCRISQIYTETLLKIPLKISLRLIQILLCSRAALLSYFFAFEVPSRIRFDQAFL